MRTYQNGAKYSRVATHFTHPTPIFSTSNEFISLLTKMKNLSETFINIYEHISPSDDIRINASNRTVGNLAPASKGKAEHKDCIIIETAEKCCYNLRQNGFVEKFIFVTSNVTDFGNPNTLHPPIDVEFQNLNMQLAVNLTHARALLNI